MAIQSFLNCCMTMSCVTLFSFQDWIVLKAVYDPNNQIPIRWLDDKSCIRSQIRIRLNWLKQWKTVILTYIKLGFPIVIDNGNWLLHLFWEVTFLHILISQGLRLQLKPFFQDHPLATGSRTFCQGETHWVFHIYPKYPQIISMIYWLVMVDHCWWLIMVIVMIINDSYYPNEDWNPAVFHRWSPDKMVILSRAPTSPHCVRWPSQHAAPAPIWKNTPYMLWRQVKKISPIPNKIWEYNGMYIIYIYSV